MGIDARARRTLDLANRLQDMTNAEWNYVKSLIDDRFREKAERAALDMKLCEIKDEDFHY